MDRRGLLLFLFCSAFSGCAAVKSFTEDPNGPVPVDVPRMTPAESYDSGVMNVTRGDYAAARRDMNRCVAMTAPDSALRGDCLVALEKLADPAALEP